MKEEDNFHTISKTANIVGVQTHVLRFWEKKFFILKPKKSVSGRRYYSSSDIEYLLMIKSKLTKNLENMEKQKKVDQDGQNKHIQ